MADWWEYEPSTTYAQREANRFRREARQEVMNRTLRNEIQSRGLTYTGSAFTPTMFDNQPVERQQRSGKSAVGLVKGFLGGAADILDKGLGPIDEVASKGFTTAMGGPIRKPWDVFRPAKRVMDFSQDEIGGNILRAVGTPSTTGAIGEMLGFGEGGFGSFKSPSEAWRQAGENMEGMNGVEKFAFKTAYDPLTYLGPSEAVKGIQLATKFQLYKPILGKMAYKSIAGGAPETKAMQDFLTNIHSFDPAFRIHGAQEALENAREISSWTQLGRKGIRNIPGVGDWLDTKFPAFFDTDASILADEVSRLKGLGDNYANTAADHIRRTLSMSDFQFSKDGRVLNVPGTPFLEDFFKDYKKYKLTKSQTQSIKDTVEPLEMTRSLLKSFGVDIKDTPTPLGTYVRRSVRETVDGVEDIGHLTPGQVKAKSNQTRFGFTPSMAKARKVASKEDGVALGIKYNDFITAQQEYIQQSFTSMAEAWWKVAAKPLSGQKGIAKRADALFKGPGEGLLENTLGKFNNVVRPVMATLDASFMGVQGLIGAATHPLIYSQSVFTALTNNSAYEALVEGAVQSGLMDDFVKHSGHWAARNDMGEFIFRGPAEKVYNLNEKFASKDPFRGIGFQPATLANTWFTKFGNSLRIKMYEAGKATRALDGATDGQLDELANFVNKATGFNPSDPSSAEKLFTFAPRYFRAQFGLLTDAITKGSVSGGMARAHLTKTLLVGTALTYGVNKALGNDTDFNPSSSNFLRIRALGKDISVFGPWDTLARAAYSAASGHPWDATKYIARSKSSPGIGTAWNVLAGETWQGKKIDFTSVDSAWQSAVTLGISVGLPMSAQNIMETPLPTNLPEAGQWVAGAVISEGGVKSTPLTKRESLDIRRDELAQLEFKTTYDKLEPHQIDQLQRAHPEELAKIEPTTDAGKAFQQRQAITVRYKAEQEKLDAALPMGRDWIDAYQELNQRKGGEFRQWQEAHPKLAAGANQAASKDPNKRALAEYYQSFDDASDATGKLDIRRLTLIQQQLEGKWTADQKAFIQRNIGLNDTPMVKAYKADQKVLKEYWQVEDQVWDKVRQVPQYSPYATFDDFYNAQKLALLEQGLSPREVDIRLDNHPIVRQMSRAISTLHKKLRLSNRNLDQTLLKWGYVEAPARPKSTGSSEPKSSWEL